MASPALARAHKKIMNLKNSTKRAREKAGELTESLLTAAEVSGAAFAFGFWEGKATSPDQFQIFGVPVPLATGIGAHLFSLFGVGRGMESHLRNIGNGSLAAYLNRMGHKLGEQSRAKSAGAVKGDDSPRAIPSAAAQGMGISEADLINSRSRPY